MVAVIVVVVVVVDVAELLAVDVVVVVATLVDVDACSRNLRFESVQGTRLPGMALKRRRCEMVNLLFGQINIKRCFWFEKKLFSFSKCFHSPNESFKKEKLIF